MNIRSVTWPLLVASASLSAACAPPAGSTSCVTAATNNAKGLESLTKGAPKIQQLQPTVWFQFASAEASGRAKGSGEKRSCHATLSFTRGDQILMSTAKHCLDLTKKKDLELVLKDDGNFVFLSSPIRPRVLKSWEAFSAGFDSKRIEELDPTGTTNQLLATVIVGKSDRMKELGARLCADLELDLEGPADENAGQRICSSFDDLGVVELTMTELSPDFQRFLTERKKALKELGSADEVSRDAVGLLQRLEKVDLAADALASLKDVRRCFWQPIGKCLLPDPLALAISGDPKIKSEVLAIFGRALSQNLFPAGQLADKINISELNMASGRFERLMTNVSLFDAYSKALDNKRKEIKNGVRTLLQSRIAGQGLSIQQNISFLNANKETDFVPASVNLNMDVKQLLSSKSPQEKNGLVSIFDSANLVSVLVIPKKYPLKIFPNDSGSIVGAGGVPLFAVSTLNGAPIEGLNSIPLSLKPRPKPKPPIAEGKPPVADNGGSAPKDTAPEKKFKDSGKETNSTSRSAPEKGAPEVTKAESPNQPAEVGSPEVTKAEPPNQPAEEGAPVADTSNVNAQVPVADSVVKPGSGSGSGCN